LHIKVRWIAGLPSRHLQQECYLCAMQLRQLFLQHVGQTSEAPLALEITRAKGSFLYGPGEKKYIDLIGGISVCNVGHGNEAVITAVQRQAADYMHVMVYGELVQSPQVTYAALLAGHLPENLNAVYFTNSGSEATEGAMKLAKRYTGRTEIVAFNNSYHGSTQGSLSIMGDEYWRNAFRPLLPGIHHVAYNNFESLDYITDRTACVIMETIQAEAGVLVPDVRWMRALRERCTETGTLLILDEIQVGFGRTGTLWGFEHFEIVPDVLLLGKALGGGMPLGAFVADVHMMNALTKDPVLGHITTFGGHPVSCAAGKAAMEYLLQEQLFTTAEEKGVLFAELLQHPAITYIHQKGLMLAVGFKDFETNKAIIDTCIENGVFTDWFLFAAECLRIVPPLTITEDEIREACAIILKSIAAVVD